MRRDRDQGAKRRWHAAAQGQAGQDRGTHIAGHGAVYQRHRHIERRDEAEQRQPRQGPPADATRLKAQQRHGQHKRAEQRDSG